MLLFNYINIIATIKFFRQFSASPGQRALNRNPDHLPPGSFGTENLSRPKRESSAKLARKIFHFKWELPGHYREIDEAIKRAGKIPAP